MNHRKIKKVKNPKACGSCANCIEYVDQGKFACLEKPIEANDKPCDDYKAKEKRAMNKPSAREIVSDDVTKVYNYLNDIVISNDSISPDTAMLLVREALAGVQRIAKALEISCE